MPSIPPAAPAARQASQRAEETMPPPPAAAPPQGTLHALAASLRAFASSLVSLAVLEGKQAALSLAFMVGFGVAAALLVTTGWIAAIGCLLGVLVANDMVGWPWALGIAALVSFAAAAGLVALIVVRGRDLAFPATRRQLALDLDVAKPT
ncbi:MAG: hypothetical protein ABI624_17120 [Casimicrobiaceae bacterium]